MIPALRRLNTPGNSRSPMARLACERGYAMAGLMLVMVMLLVFSSFSVRQTALDQRSTSHVDTAHRALLAAEAGIAHALNRINASGAIDFENDISNRWNTILGSAPLTMSGDSNVSYEIAVAADPADPADRGTVTVTGRAPLLARRTIQVGIAKGAFDGSPGAIHLADPGNVEASFRGNAFDVDGNNYDRFGNLVGDIVKPGITALNSDNVDEVTSSLNHQQYDNVRGLGFDPASRSPSVMETGGPDNNALEQFVQDILSRPGVVTTGAKNINGNQTFGTLAAPQITYMSNDDVRLNGNAQGAGILIADGSMTINGTLDFIGLIIVRGDTTINSMPDDETTVLGNAFILGSLWTGNLNITVGGSAIIDYCHECLWLVDSASATTGTIPRPMRVVSWRDL